MADSLEKSAREQDPAEAEQELTAREHVQAAAQILKAMGPERARVGWMLEDTLMYLDELEHQNTVPENATGAPLENLSKLVNG